MEGRRVAYWQEAEIQLLLQLFMGSGRAEGLMRSSSLPTMEIFRGVARWLSRAGYARTAVQCRSKFKTLKAAFLQSLEEHGPMPPGVPSHPFTQCCRRCGTGQAVLHGRSGVHAVGT